MKGEMKMKQMDYIKGKCNKGAVIENIYAGQKSYIAVTISTSKTFKSLKGAEKYMDKFEYKKVI